MAFNFLVLASIKAFSSGEGIGLKVGDFEDLLELIFGTLENFCSDRLFVFKMLNCLDI